MRLLPFIFATVMLANDVFGQLTSQPNSSEIKLRLKKLNFLGSVLYLAAHPDDENTRIIAYLSNGRLASTGYLSITRGGGGQNLIGAEIRDRLGVVRTQELLAARRIDGGRQFFTRAVDFGYSKNAEESLRIWGKKDVLSDVVRIIRKFQPDIIITRFPADSRAGHGHHTASAMLAQEAFHLASDPAAFPEQVAELGVWQPASLYTNTGRWWNSRISGDTPGVVTMNVGQYSSLLGTSYSEIAGKSRTQHKSQGFGVAGARGERIEFLEHEKGFRAEKDIFEPVDTTWSRLVGGGAVQPLVTKLIRDFDEENPAASVRLLLAVRKKIEALQNGVWKQRKLKAVNHLIKDCMGLYIGVTADDYYAPQKGQVQCSFELVNRSKVPLSLRKVGSADLSFDSTFTKNLLDNQPLIFTTHHNLRGTLPYSNPYWLREKHSPGHFTVLDKGHIGVPENKPSITYTFELEVEGEPLTLTVPLVYKWVDPVKGELWRPFGIVPLLSVHLPTSVVIFNNDGDKKIDVLVKSYSKKELKGEVTLDLPENWRSEPSVVHFELSGREDEQMVTFTVYPSDKEAVSSLQAVAKVDGKTYNRSLQIIDYEHIPAQFFISPSEAKVVRINLKKEGSLIGYIAGAGDKIPAALRSMGYEVWEMSNDEIVKENLAKVDAVVLGIRALNTNERIPFFMGTLMDYVYDGGTLVVQYNTNRRLKVDADKFSPYPLLLSRVRVTDENSAVEIIKPEHPVFNFPNTITPRDFDNWVQERGLYFPSQWDAHFEPLLSMHDPDEPDAKGALLVAKYGKGHYIYTGISFFRQLPVGVPGAYKLFTNLVSIGKSQK